MTFRCPDCGFRETLRIIQSIDLPPDSRSDDIILQIVLCDRCHFRGAAIYEESRRGNLDSESWEHRGYRLNEQDLAHLETIIARCQANHDKHCQCPTHQTLRQTDAFGRWQFPIDIDWANSFPMQNNNNHS
jgi:hypothetical protein